jgi:TRAP-type mannitol/chloroaromatic compound transport system permease large subunit
MTDIFRGVTPFVVICLFAVALLTAFPRLALWLPSLM